tara:strand:+ start:93 stop:356 length:264 start_codon:yes stop_codon:yes gene_type:complete
MNMCIYGTIATGVETLRERVKYNMERGASEFCSDCTLADNGNNSFVWLGNVTNMDSMGAFLNTDEEKKWDSDNGCVYKVYTMSEMSE